MSLTGQKRRKAARTCRYRGTSGWPCPCSESDTVGALQSAEKLPPLPFPTDKSRAEQSMDGQEKTATLGPASSSLDGDLLL